MNHLSKRALFGIAIVALACTACVGSGGGAANGAPPMVPGARFVDDAGTLNIAGQYAGTVQDSHNGAGHVTASLAQHKTTVGGWLYFVYPKLAFRTSTARTVSGTSVDGVSVATIHNEVCTLDVMGKYDSSTNRLSGSYKAVHGCTGDHGTYTLKQKCYYVRAGDIRPETGLKPC